MNASKTKWVRLGNYIERSMVNNSELKYGPEHIVGVTSKGTFAPTKAQTIDIDLKSYKLVNNGDFVYNPSRFNIGSIAYRTQGFCIVSHLYVVFRLTEYGKKYFNPEFLYMYMYRKEFFRMVDYLNFGSQRPEFNFFELSDIRVPLPPIEVQRELVDTYNGLKALAEQNEAMISRLTAACQAYIVDCRDKYPSVKVEEYLSVDDITNSENRDLEFLGININKEFMPTTATIEGLNKQKYKVLTKGRFVFSGMQTGRDVAIRVGLYSDDTDALISPAYTTFSVAKDKYNKLLPEYLFLQFKRAESDRLGWFYSDSSIRSNLDWGRFCEFQIPLPPIDVQQAIVDVYHCMERAKRIAATAREKLKTLCPALVQRAVHS